MTITALDFLERFAGAGSQWAVRGHAVFDKGGHSMETGARDLGDVLRAWAEQVEAGIIVVPQYRPTVLAKLRVLT